jgi:flagellar biosynthesis protein FliR
VLFPPIDGLLERLPAFLLIGVRVGVLLFLLPGFDARTVPAAVRLWLTLLLAVLLLPVVSAASIDIADPVALVIAVAREAAIGALLGLVVRLLISAATYGGRLAGVHIGFGFAGTIDPSTGEEDAMLDRLQERLAIVLFMVLGAHRGVIAALAESFRLVPIGKAVFTPQLAAAYVDLFAQSIVLAVQIAAPVIASVTLAEVAIGLLSRSVPQFNVFSVGFGIRIALGLAVFGLALPAAMGLMNQAIGGVPLALRGILGQLAP